MVQFDEIIGQGTDEDDDDLDELYGESESDDGIIDKLAKIKEKEEIQLTARKSSVWIHDIIK